MATSGVDRDNLILSAQTGDPAAISRLLAVCQADARRYAYKCVFRSIVTSHSGLS